MSFVSKAVKKVFNGVKKVASKVWSGVKRVVKSDWFKIAAVAAATFFTAGLASGGFTMGAGGGIGGFFSGVGTTISNGFSTIWGGLKSFGADVKNAIMPGAVTQTTQQPSLGLLEQSPAISSGGGMGSAIDNYLYGVEGQSPIGALATVGVQDGGLGSAFGQLVPGALPGTAQPTKQPGFLGRVFGWLTDPGIGGSMLRSGIIAGWQSYERGKEREAAEWERDNQLFYLGPMRGGSSELPAGALLPARVSYAQATAQDEASQPVPSMLPANMPTAQPPGTQPVPATQQQPMVAQAQQPGLLGPMAPAAQPTTQPPPATQPQQGRSPTGFVPELLGVA